MTFKMLPEDYRPLADKAIDNWAKWRDYSSGLDPDDKYGFTIVYNQSRDAGILERSNAREMEKRLQPYLDNEDDIFHYTASHWAVGWISGYRIRVFNADGITEAFMAYCDIMSDLEDYPILDEMAYSEMEYEENAEWLHSEYDGRVIDDVPDGWEYELLGHLHDLSYDSDDSGLICGDWRQFQSDCQEFLQKNGWWYA